jgi:hypothetical protein
VSGTAGHCPTCRCPEKRYHLTVFAPNEKLYGRCGACGQARFEVEVFDNRTREHLPRTAHCGCCDHIHLEPGGYEYGHRPVMAQEGASR